MRVRILQTFDGYPDGPKPVRFVAGQELTVGDDFGALIVAKGHAVKIGGKSTKKEGTDESV